MVQSTRATIGTMHYTENEYEPKFPLEALTLKIYSKDIPIIPSLPPVLKEHISLTNKPLALQYSIYHTCRQN